GPVGGAYDRLGGAIAGVVSASADSIAIAGKASPGSVWNIRALQSGEVQFALTQSDILSGAVRGQGVFAEPTSGIQALATLYEETLHLVATRKSGVESYQDLEGMRVGLGPPDSGTNATARTVLAAHGVNLSSLKVSETSVSEAVEALDEGNLDAYFAVSTIPCDPVSRSLQSGKAVLVPVDSELCEELDERGALRLTDVFADDYEGLEDDAETLAVDAILCVRDDVSADVVFEIMRICYKQRDRLADTAGIELATFTPDEAAEIPFALHPGATLFYYEQNAVELPVQVRTGIYVYDIYNLDIRTRTYDVQAMVWFKWRGHLKDGDDVAFKLINGELGSRELKETEHFGGWTYKSYEITATMRGRFDLVRYPFDEQLIELAIQHDTEDEDRLIFVEDLEVVSGEEGLAKTIGTREVADWKVKGVDQAVTSFKFPTDFGSPTGKAEKAAAWSRYNVTFRIERILFPYLIKFMGPLVIIVLMAFVVFFIHPKEFEVQAGIVITALLSCVAFHITQADNLPDVGYLVTADKFFIVSYVVIFIALVQVVLENYYFHRENLTAALKVDQVSRILFPILFFGPIAYLIGSSL
ncbi:MAG: TAXI family TRAP transporter solute-binding subunit, partial [Planctomycetota bacterium]